MHHAAEELSALLARADFVAPYELFADVLSARGGRGAALSRLGPEAADPLDEFLALALAYERAHIPSLQGFLHWLATGAVEIKRDLDQRDRDEVRVLTVHGAKGLQAPIVFLPDTLQAPAQTPRLLWTADGLPLWSARKDLDAPAAQAARSVALQRRDEEYRRLLYVAMTRAEDRLYLCGWRTKKPAPSHCWYDLAAAGLAALGEPQSFDFAPLIGEDGWAGAGHRHERSQQVSAKRDAYDGGRMAEAAELPSWARRLPPTEPAPPRPLAPSRPTLAEPAARSPLGLATGTRDGAGFKRGLLVHRLLQILPELDVARRRQAAEQFLARPVHGLAAAERRRSPRRSLPFSPSPILPPCSAPSRRPRCPSSGSSAITRSPARSTASWSWMKKF